MSVPAVHASIAAALVAGVLTSHSAAQVRMNLRTDMQIATLQSGGFWPVEVNEFATGDVDGDGDLDLLAALNWGGGRLWFNDGHGGFTRYVDLIGARSRSCALFDADGDGDLDVLLGGGGTVYGWPDICTLFRNDGNGAFTPVPTIPSHPVNDSIDTGCIVVGDLDGDGDRDIVLFTLYGSHLRYWRNDGNCTFTDQTAAALPAGASADNGTLADVEPDGDLDIVTATHLYRNNGLGVFTSEPPIPWPIPVSSPAAVDVDGDSLIDEVGIRTNIWATPVNVPYVRRNLGGGVFQDVSTTWFEPHALVDHTYWNGYPHWAIAVFDADGDGDPDLVTAGVQGRGTTSTTIGIPPKVFLNSNHQRFVDAGQPALPTLATVARAVAAGDIDGDGDVDLVFSYGYGGMSGYTMWKQDAAGRFQGVGIPSGGGVPFGALALADVDGDQDLDLISVSGSLYAGGGVQHRLALNDGSGNFTDVTATHMPVISSLGLSCAVGDIDGDGDLDIVIGSYAYMGAPLILLRNTGGGFFVDASAQLPPTPCSATAIALRDFDGDGDRDIVVGGATFPVQFFANDGTGHFTDETASRIPATPTSGQGGDLSVIDLDNDGDLDIAIGNVDLHNNGAGVFTSSTVPFTRTHVLHLDGDTVPDALIPGPAVAGGPVLWWDFNSNGHTVLPVDLDRDGDLDLVVCPWEPDNDWQMVRIELLYNLRRDLRVATLPRVGHPYRLQLRATNGNAATFAIAAFATATLPQPVEIPGWGTLQIDPTQMAVLGTALIPDADTTAELSMPIPSTPTLFGLPLSCQALFVPIGNEAQTHLSNAMTFPLER